MCMQIDNKEKLARATDLLRQLASDMTEYGSGGNKHRITISGSHRLSPSGFSYAVPDYLLSAIRRGIEAYIIDLEDKIYHES